MAIYKWIEEKVPKDLEIKQVYGIAFDLDGRVFLHIDDGKYTMTGGKPEPKDKNMEETLKREFLEEVNITLKNILYLGYQYVDEENGIKPYAQVRMCALIDKVYENRPDLDNGKIYKRVLVSPQKTKKYLNWGECGNMQIDAAINIAKNKYNIQYIDAEDIII